MEYHTGCEATTCDFAREPMTCGEYLDGMDTADREVGQ